MRVHNLSAPSIFLIEQTNISLSISLRFRIKEDSKYCRALSIDHNPLKSKGVRTQRTRDANLTTCMHTSHYSCVCISRSIYHNHMIGIFWWRAVFITLTHDNSLPTISPEINPHRPSSFMCCNCATTQADFFVTNGSLENPTEVVALCFQCYVYKTR